MSKIKTVAEKWQLEYKKQIEYYTFDSYRSPLKDIVTYFNDREIDDIAPLEIKQFIEAQIKTGKCRQTINLRLIVLRHLYKYAIVEGLAQRNPAELISLPRNLPKNKRSLPPNDVIERIKNASPDTQYWMIAKCLLYLGCRRGEVLALSKDSIDFQSSIIHINKQVEFHGNTPTIKYKTKTKSSNRQIILPQKLKYDLLNFSKTRDNYLFVEENGNLLRGTTIRRGWDNLGLGITMHQLRHAYATILYEAGVDEKTAQELMGHSSIVTMRNIYTHVREGQLQKAAIQLNNFL